MHGVYDRTNVSMRLFSWTIGLLEVRECILDIYDKPAIEVSATSAGLTLSCKRREGRDGPDAELLDRRNALSGMKH